MTEPEGKHSPYHLTSPQAHTDRPDENYPNLKQI